MRKIFSILLALCLIIGVTACAGASEDEIRTWIEDME